MNTRLHLDTSRWIIIQLGGSTIISGNTVTLPPVNDLQRLTKSKDLWPHTDYNLVGSKKCLAEFDSNPKTILAIL